MEGRFRVSLHPPPTNDDAAPWPSWVLLDMHAYIADRQNSTTAFSKTRDGRHAIQVTFCFAHPPRVSYFCVYSPDLPPPKFSSVPKVIATEGGLALIRIVLAGQSEIGNPRVNDYYIYQVAYEVSLDNNPAQLELLPKLQDDQGTPRPTLERLHIGQPTLSLHNDDVVYFMTKVDHRDRSKAWVIAVDMRNRTLQAVAEFGAQRTLGICYTYTHSRISKYLNMAPGTKCHLKRSGKECR